MEKISFEQIGQIWESNDKPVQLYIHSAFCKSVCKYCAYKGRQYEENLYKKYFYEYLPEQILKYKDIISRQTVNSIYFGGGTPNTEEDLANLMPVFSLLHSVECKEKIIELHVGLPITDKTIDVLKQENFTTVILCIQTFDEKKLDDENRVYYANNNIDELIGKFRKAGIYTCMDLISFPDNSDRIITDIETVASFTNRPDEITIAPLYGHKDFNDILTIHNTMDKKGYVPADLVTSEKYALMKRTWRFVLSEKKKDYLNEFFTFIPYLSETGSTKDSTLVSCLGIGSTTGMIKQTYSRVGLYTYYEIWDGFSTEYRLRKQTSIKQILADYLKDMPDVLPEETEIIIRVSNPKDSSTKEASADATVNIIYNIPTCVNPGLEDQYNKLCAILKQ